MRLQSLTPPGISAWGANLSSNIRTTLTHKIRNIVNISSLNTPIHIALEVIYRIIRYEKAYTFKRKQ